MPVYQLIKRLLSVIPVVFGVVLLTFLLIHLVPGDPVEVMLGESANVADSAALREELGLNQPLMVQFGQYLNKLAHGDLGRSIHTQTPISELIQARYPATVKLAVVAFGNRLNHRHPNGYFCRLACRPLAGFCGHHY